MFEGGRCPGRQRKYWMDKVQEWTSLPLLELFTMASCRKDPEENLCWIVHHVSTTIQSVKGQNSTELFFLFFFFWRCSLATVSSDFVLAGYNSMQFCEWVCFVFCRPCFAPHGRFRTFQVMKLLFQRIVLQIPLGVQEFNDTINSRFPQRPNTTATKTSFTPTANDRHRQKENICVDSTKHNHLG